MSGHQSISKRQECLCRSYIGTLGAQNFPIGDQRSFHCPGSICPSTSFKLLRSSQDRLEVEKVSSRTLVYTTHQEGLPRVIPGPSFNPWHLPADDVMACDVLRASLRACARSHSDSGSGKGFGFSFTRRILGPSLGVEPSSSQGFGARQKPWFLRLRILRVAIFPARLFYFPSAGSKKSWDMTAT